MITSEHDNLAGDLSILGKKAVLSMSARQRVRDKLFKKIGQVDLIDAVQTHTEVAGLVMPLASLLSIFKPTRVSFSWGATTAIGLAVMALTFTTGALANNAEPGSGLFYTVRKAIEGAQLVLQTDPTKKAELQLAIATNRLQTLQSADPKNLSAVLTESKRAVTEAQTAVASLNKGATSDDLTAKLAAIIGSQKLILTTILEANPDNDAIQKGALAVRDALDLLLPDEKIEEITGEVASDKIDILVPATTVPVAGNVSLTGAIGSYTARPVLLVGDTRYFLDGATINLIPYMGSNHADVKGYLDPATQTIQLSELFIDSKLVWETPDKINNNLPGVEPSQN